MPVCSVIFLIFIAFVSDRMEGSNTISLPLIILFCIIRFTYAINEHQDIAKSQRKHWENMCSGLHLSRSLDRICSL